MEKYISHVADRDLTLQLFEQLPPGDTRTKMTRDLAVEFCHTFNTKVGIPVAVKTSDQSEKVSEMVQNHLHPLLLSLYTPEGMPCGTIETRYDGEFYVVHKSPLITKEKASGRCDKHGRDSKTVKGLINAIKRNKHEQPTTKILLSTFTGGIKYALTNMDGSRTVNVSFSHPSTVTELVKYYLGETNHASTHDAAIREEYKKFLDAAEANQKIRDTKRRFMDGCKTVAVLRYPSSYYKPVYFVADAEWTVKDAEAPPSFTNMSFVNSLNDDERVAADAMMIRTYMQGQSPTNDNEFCLPTIDRYLPDIDVSTGFNRTDCLWVLIPKNGE